MGLGVGPRGQAPASLLIYGSHCSLSYSSGGSRGAGPLSFTIMILSVRPSLGKQRAFGSFKLKGGNVAGKSKAAQIAKRPIEQTADLFA